MVVAVLQAMQTSRGREPLGHPPEQPGDPRGDLRLALGAIGQPGVVGGIDHRRVGQQRRAPRRAREARRRPNRRSAGAASASAFRSVVSSIDARHPLPRSPHERVRTGPIHAVSSVKGSAPLRQARPERLGIGAWTRFTPSRRLPARFDPVRADPHPAGRRGRSARGRLGQHRRDQRAAHRAQGHGRGDAAARHGQGAGRGADRLAVLAGVRAGSPRSPR